ncbi:hypothetical protein [Sediminibacillus massiliensis]|uniref:hypothetical protein n=1 Tax=Sediminibacillus massiliensis TaxID=1926277 RepID=UPI000988756E|nr:hypothetical protein [Sediminibacillus massiliensis]
MGYILPIPLYQYQDYHERVTGKKPNPFFIERPYKANLNIKHKEIETSQDQCEKQTGCKKPNHSAALFVPSMHKSKVAEKIYAEVTGKGRHFSESI